MTYELALEPDSEEEKPRLWSRISDLRCPVDEVAPEHAKVDELCVRWGRWVGRRSKRTSLASIEAMYDKGSGTPPATAPLSADPKLAVVEFAVQSMLLLQHRRLVIMLYVFRCSSWTICRAIKLPFEAYYGETYRARGMVAQRVNEIIPGST